MKNHILSLSLTLFISTFCLPLFSQTIDSVKTIQLKEIDVLVKPTKNEIERLPDIQSGIIYAGKKNEVIKLGNIDADLSINNSRQVFGKVPGVTVWENDGSGIQVCVATRGLSPNRNWEFNTRQNGGDIAGETFGYPESYYTPPLEAVDRIELVRGAASLQYGPQFGGLMNYVIKKGNSRKPISIETQQTVGNFGLFNSYNAIGGTYKKISYYTYFHHRGAEGWRQNNQYNINTGYASLTYYINSKMDLSFDFTKMNYVSKQPGGLTDVLFEKDSKQSLRNRNWMQVPWNVGSLNFNYKVTESTLITAKVFGVMAQRNSVGFVAALNVADTFNSVLNSFNPRQVDLDSYLNYGSEIRVLQSYTVLGQMQALSIGVRYYNGVTNRKQLGKGNTDSDLNLNITDPNWGRNLTFNNENYSVFAEHLINIGKRFSLVPGIRYESVTSKANGYYKLTGTNQENISEKSRTRNIFLAGVGSQFKISSTTNLYANYSQNYRPITYSELTPSGTTEVIDPDLKDAFGYNADAGYRGTFKNSISFDIGAFYLLYNNRIGTITQNGAPYKTNIGTSESKGIETYLEVDVLGLIFNSAKFGHFNIYGSYSYIDAVYIRWDNPSIVNDPAKTLVGKKVEYAPQQTQRYGATYIYKKISGTFQFNNISSVYTDAVNSETPNATATTGKIPAYTILDASLSAGFAKYYNFKAGVNNIADTKYFTRRAGGYPGPGLMPGNGRTFFVSLGAKF